MLAFTASFGRRLIHCLCLSSFRVIKHALWLPWTHNFLLQSNQTPSLVTLHTEYPPSGESITFFGYPAHGISSDRGIYHALWLP